MSHCQKNFKQSQLKHINIQNILDVNLLYKLHLHGAESKILL